LSAASDRSGAGREVIAEPASEAALLVARASCSPGSPHRFDLPLPVRFHRLKPFLAEHDLPLSPFLSLPSFDVFKLPEIPARTCHEHNGYAHP
jgi:hypothetical protein